MKRLSILVFFDNEGIADAHVISLIKNTAEISDRFIILVNGIITDDSFSKFQKYTDDIYIRKNIGYDAGAYIDFFSKYITREELTYYDEVLMLNDTFFGPFYPWQIIFSNMEQNNCDFWGLSRHLGDNQTRMKNGMTIPLHVQSYFLVFRKPIIQNGSLHDFFCKLDYPATIMDAIECFEISLSLFLHRMGYRSYSYIEQIGYQLDINDNPYLSKPFQLISMYKFPILKRKVCTLEYWKEYQMSLEYIKNNTEYDIEMITEKANRTDSSNIYPYQDIISFYNTHNRVFFYGNGRYAEIITNFFDYMDYKIEKYIVSSDDSPSKNTISFDNVEFKEGDGVVVAVNYNAAANEIYPKLVRRLSPENILMPKNKFTGRNQL